MLFLFWKWVEKSFLLYVDFSGYGFEKILAILSVLQIELGFG